jgi:peroxiredoxin
MRYKGIVLILIFLVGLGTIYSLSRDGHAPKRGIYTGDPAPDFEARDLNGKLWRLSEIKGKVVLINFWATWCDTCKMEKPFFNRLYQNFKGNDGIVFLTMLFNDDLQKGREYIQKYAYDFPVLEDRQGVAAQYGVRAVPETFVIDKRGKIAQKIVGPMKWDSEEVREAIERLLRS